MTDFVDSIRKAVSKLKHSEDGDWTQAGLPDVSQVRALADDPSITRADIEAACPKVERNAVTEGATDATQEPVTAPETTTQTAAETGEANTPAITETPASDQETDTQDDGGFIEEPDTMSIGDFMVRGMLMAIIIRLPSSLRVLADGEMLDGMAAFVDQFDMQEERMIAVEMIKSISEVKMNEIPSGQYKHRVLAAMAVVRRDEDVAVSGVNAADDRDAAAKRLAKITGQGGAPKPNNNMPSALDGADPEQAEAHARLYGEGVADGARDAQE